MSDLDFRKVIWENDVEGFKEYLSYGGDPRELIIDDEGNDIYAWSYVLDNCFVDIAEEMFKWRNEKKQRVEINVDTLEHYISLMEEQMWLSYESASESIDTNICITPGIGMKEFFKKQSEYLRMIELLKDQIAKEKEYTLVSIPMNFVASVSKKKLTDIREVLKKPNLYSEVHKRVFKRALVKATQEALDKSDEICERTYSSCLECMIRLDMSNHIKSRYQWDNEELNVLKDVNENLPDGYKVVHNFINNGTKDEYFLCW